MPTGQRLKGRGEGGGPRVQPVLIMHGRFEYWQCAPLERQAEGAVPEELREHAVGTADAEKDGVVCHIR